MNRQLYTKGIERSYRREIDTVYSGYLDNAKSSNPNIPNWRAYPQRTMKYLAREGLTDEMKALAHVCDCIAKGGWQEIAEIGTIHGHEKVIQLASEYEDLDWETIAIIARSQGYSDIASIADGYGWAPVPNKDSDYYVETYGPVIGAGIQTSGSEPYVQWDDEKEDYSKWFPPETGWEISEDFFPQEPQIHEDPLYDEDAYIL